MQAEWTNSTAAVPGLSAEGAVDVAKGLLAKWQAASRAAFAAAL